MKGISTSITKSSGKGKYNCSITLNPPMVPKFLDLFGIQMLQGERTELPDGQIQFDFNADEEARRMILDMFNMLSGFTIEEN
jgi:hypothetical protein